MSEMKVFKVDDGGECVWAIADHPEKARAISREYLRGDGPLDNEILEDEEIVEMAMDAPLTITDDDGPCERRTQTCAEWIKECREGFLATTCF